MHKNVCLTKKGGTLVAVEPFNNLLRRRLLSLNNC